MSRSALARHSPRSREDDKMPRIFDNIDTSLLPALRETLEISDRADFCVGYFNLRGWKQIDQFVERWDGGQGKCCRLLVGMQRLPQDFLRDALGVVHRGQVIDNQTALRLKKRLAEEFRNQLMVGSPTNEDEAARARPQTTPWELACANRRSTSCQ
jgi:hypothetical protein